MKSVALVVAAVIVGFLLGGLGPRRQLAASNKRISDLEGQLYDAKRAHGGRFLPIPGFDELPTGPSAPSIARTMPKSSPPDGASASPEASPTPVDVLAAFQIAADAQKMRAAQMRQAAFEQADLDPEKQKSVDAVVADMNKKLADYSQKLLDLAMQTGQGHDPDPLQLLQLTHDVSGVLAESQQGYQTAVGEGYSNLDPDEQQVWNYVDLSIFQDAVKQMDANGLLPQQ
jgi:hypothetical protein